MNTAMSGSSTTLFAPLSTTSSATSTSIASPAHRRPTSLAMSTFTWFVPLCLCVCVCVYVSVCLFVCVFVCIRISHFFPPTSSWFAGLASHSPPRFSSLCLFGESTCSSPLQHK